MNTAQYLAFYQRDLKSVGRFWVQLDKSKYPFVKVDMFRADNEKLLNRILTESAANKFNGDAIMISSFEVRVLLQKKLLQRYVSPHAKYYPEGFADKEGYWTSVYSIPRVIAYNTNLAKPDVAPKSWEDILHPVGEAVLACPIAPPSGTPAS